jgi:replicative DNA helicase
VGESQKRGESVLGLKQIKMTGGDDNGGAGDGGNGTEEPVRRSLWPPKSEDAESVEEQPAPLPTAMPVASTVETPAPEPEPEAAAPPATAEVVEAEQPEAAPEADVVAEVEATPEPEAPAEAETEPESKPPVLEQADEEDHDHTPYYEIVQANAESAAEDHEEEGGVSTERLDERIAEFHVQQAKKHLEKGIEKIWLAGCELLEDGRFEELRSFVDVRTHNLQREAHRIEVTPYSLEELEAGIRDTKEGLVTGYPGLDKFVRIPQEALTLMAGLPSHGKTTLMLNLFVNLVEAYPEKSFFFFSYEETKKHLAMKILTILSGHVFDESRNFSKLEEYLKSGRTDVPAIERGKQVLKELTESGRLWLIDESLHVDEVREQLAALKTKYSIGAVFVDYLQKVKIRGTHPDRYAELQRISGQFLEMAKELELAIMLGAQLETRIDIEDCVKLDQLREAGDIEQDANLIMAIYNRAMAKARTGRKIHDRTIDVTVSILKNRNGAVNHDVRLRFDRPILQMFDVSEKEWKTANTPGQIRRV